jgi:hypothetical protein
MTFDLDFLIDVTALHILFDVAIHALLMVFAAE